MARNDHRPYIYHLYKDEEWNDGMGRWCVKNATIDNVIENIKSGLNIEIECDGTIYRLMFANKMHAVFASVSLDKLDNPNDTTELVSRAIQIMVVGIDFATGKIVRIGKNLT